MITQDITLHGLTPAQIMELQEFVDAVFVRGLTWQTNRPADVQRTVNELVNSGAVPIGRSTAEMSQTMRSDTGYQVPASASIPGTPPLSPAPVAAPSSSSAGVATASSAPLDNRGVPHHPDFHGALDGEGGGKKADGSWKRRRNHDKAAADVYEAPYLAPKRAAEANPTLAPAASPVPAPATVPPVTSTVDPTAVFGAPIIVPPAASPGSVTELEQLWTKLAAANVVNQAHAQQLHGWHGYGHPIGSAGYAQDAEKRQQAIDWLKQYLQFIPAPIAA